jgi:hypothetical protein
VTPRSPRSRATTTRRWSPRRGSGGPILRPPRGRAKALLSFWEPHGRAHFRVEEEILLPAFAARGDPYHPLVARVLCDHVAIRRGVGALAHSRACELGDLHQLGILLAAHVRLEERELFPLIESP